MSLLGRLTLSLGRFFRGRPGHVEAAPLEAPPSMAFLRPAHARRRPYGDGLDLERMERAEAKRARIRARNLRNAGPGWAIGW